MSWLEEIQKLPLIDHHCHFIIGATNDWKNVMLKATSEAGKDYPKKDTVERMAWWAFKKETELFTNNPTIAHENFEEYGKLVNKIFSYYNYRALLIDTGFSPQGALPFTSFKEIGKISMKPIFRLEYEAEKVFKETKSFSDWWELLKYRISHARENGFVGFKSIAAYRGGLRINKPSLNEIESLFDKWRKNGSKRLSDKKIISFIIWNAAPLMIKQEMPLQFHCGYGDSDINLITANPVLLQTLIKEYCYQGLKVVLLHCYPFHRTAAYMASIYPNVFFDISLINPLAPTGVNRIMSEALELAPFSRFLFASDAHTFPEFYGLAAHLFKNALSEELKKNKFVSIDKKLLWAEKVCYKNSFLLYHLEGLNLV